MYTKTLVNKKHLKVHFAPQILGFGIAIKKHVDYFNGHRWKLCFHIISFDIGIHLWKTEIEDDE